MSGSSSGKQKMEFVRDYVVFDLETTGTSCNKDSIVEISAIKVLNGQIADEYSTLVNPQCPIPYYASRVNGITDDMVKDAPLIKEALEGFLEFIEDLILVGHNIHTFDLKFIYRDCEHYFGKIPGNDYVDTLKMSRICLPELKHHALGDLAEFYGISTEGAHRALNDCRMNRAVYEKMGEILQDKMESIKKCPKCGSILVQRKGKFGEFWGCSGYSNCRYTENI